MTSFTSIDALVDGVGRADPIDVASACGISAVEMSIVTCNIFCGEDPLRWPERKSTQQQSTQAQPSPNRSHPYTQPCRLGPRRSSKNRTNAIFGDTTPDLAP
jgi:hypothetical protein